MDDNNELKSHVKGHLAYDLMKYVVVGIVGWSAYAIGANSPAIQQALQRYSAGVIGASVGISSFLAFRLGSRSRRRPIFPALECDFWIESKKIDFVYESSTSIRYSRKYRLRALRDVESFSDRYSWTGTRINRMLCADNQFDLKLTRKKNLFQHFEVRFNRTVKKGTIVDVQINWELDDSNRQMTPFISALIDAPTDSLMMSVTLPPQLGVEKVVHEVSHSHGAPRGFSSNVVKLELGKDVWSIPNPKLLHLYEVRWTLDPNQSNEHASNTSTKTA